VSLTGFISLIILCLDGSSDVPLPNGVHSSHVGRCFFG